MERWFKFQLLTLFLEKSELFWLGGAVFHYTEISFICDTHTHTHTQNVTVAGSGLGRMSSNDTEYLWQHMPCVLYPSSSTLGHATHK